MEREERGGVERGERRSGEGGRRGGEDRKGGEEAEGRGGEGG